MTMDEKIEEEFKEYWKSETAYPGDMKKQQMEALRAGYLAAIEETRKKLLNHGIILDDIADEDQ